MAKGFAGGLEVFLCVHMILFQQLSIIKSAAEQIKSSRTLAKILELVLAMGNQLNKATNRPSATAFRVSFLTQVST